MILLVLVFAGSTAIFRLTFGTVTVVVGAGVGVDGVIGVGVVLLLLGVDCTKFHSLIQFVVIYSKSLISLKWMHVNYVYAFFIS